MRDLKQETSSFEHETSFINCVETDEMAHNIILFCPLF